jgi:hypothetical protein
MYLQKVISKKSGSISQRYGYPDPDPHQNFMDTQHCYLLCSTLLFLNQIPAHLCNKWIVSGDLKVDVTEKHDSCELSMTTGYHLKSGEGVMEMR